MRAISIVLEIYNRTRPTHKSNTEHYIFTPNTFNYYKIMLDQSKQVIPSADAIISLLDKVVIKSLNAHDTYQVKSLLQQLWKLNSTKSSISHSETEMLEEVLKTIYSNQIENSKLAQKIDKFVRENKNKSAGDINSFTPDTIEPFFAEGINCNLLQPDGKGWQKGKLKICFEFIPEEIEPVATQAKLVKTHSSPLDEIRQLSNELASVGSIEQN
jgi:KGK domain